MNKLKIALMCTLCFLLALAVGLCLFVQPAKVTKVDNSEIYIIDNFSDVPKTFEVYSGQGGTYFEVVENGESHVSQLSVYPGSKAMRYAFPNFSVVEPKDLIAGLVPIRSCTYAVDMSTSPQYVAYLLSQGYVIKYAVMTSSYIDFYLQGATDCKRVTLFKSMMLVSPLEISESIDIYASLQNFDKKDIILSYFIEG